MTEQEIKQADETYESFTKHEEPRRSITIIAHNCSICGNDFKYPVVMTVLDSDPTNDENDGPTEDDIPGAVCGNH